MFPCVGHICGGEEGGGRIVEPSDVLSKFLAGKIPQATLLITNMKEEEVRKHYPYLEPGGSWRPTECVARYKVSSPIDPHGLIVRLFLK